MGRYPLKAAVERYIERRRLQVGKSTLDNDSRILRHIADNMEAMREEGQLKTTGPSSMGPKEIRAFLDWMRDPSAHKGKALDPDTQVRYLAKLEGVLTMNGNRVIEKMREEGYQFPQKAGRKPIRALRAEDLETIQDAAPELSSASGEPEGWRRAKARLLTIAYVATGLRPSELRLAHIEDLDTRRWRLYVRTPKGAGVWAENRTVTITPPYREGFITFLQERDDLLRYYGRKKATFLIPNLRSGQDGSYSSNHFRELKKEIQEASGIDFRLKDFRPTFATLTVEKDPNLLPDVSTQLGHSSILTTQRYYAQISAESAGSRIEKAWKNETSASHNKADVTGPIAELLEALGMGSVEELKARLISQASNTEKHGIDSKNWLPGYF
ncbi:tyrosine-type recombinase/integrase [Methanomassiliicoccus luminyensis]|uniref:tyrosine-type recombinase/integrase n=1 Tax=Methanomassiliicoccus luminyensis TaxID=1080712 RepID=UPI000AAA2352|nr:site-specific integrase [Methanomassiliicoccus luminyensis]